MKRVFFISFLLAGSCAPKTPQGPQAGKALFVQAGCISCHRVGSQGSAVGPDLSLVGFRHSAAWLDAWLENPQAWKPGTLMPNVRLSPAARKAIVDYLAGLQGQDWPKGGRPWDAPSLLKDPVSRGKVIYARAGCINCHGPAGTGGQPNNNVPGNKIPALNNVADTYSKPELIAKISRGVPSPQKADPKGPAPLVFMPPWKQTLDAAEIDAVSSYLLSLKSGAPKSEW